MLVATRWSHPAGKRHKIQDQSQSAHSFIATTRTVRLGKLMFRTSRFLTEQAMTGNTLAQRRREVRLAATSDALPLS